MSQVLHQVREVDPNNSEAVKDVVNAFFQNLLKTEGSNSTKWLRTLVDIINRFPKYCMSHRATIENLICESLNSNDYYYVIEAAKCAHVLQQVRPAHEKTATPKTSWRDHMNLLCNSAHSLITAIFPNAVDMYKGTKNFKDPETLSTLSAALLNVTSTNNIQLKTDRKTLLQPRLRNIFCFIQAMLVEVYPAPKPVHPQTVLDVLVRALSVSSGSNNTSVDVAIIKTEALRTLDALVACLGSNLIPFSALVFRLLMQTFRWTTDNADKNFSEVRCKAYGSMTMWLNTLHTHRAATGTRVSWEDELTDHIVKDIAIPEKIVQLTIGAQPTKHMSKKAKRKLANAKLLESSIASHMPGEKNKISVPEKVDDEVAIAALECAETFLLVCGRFLKTTTHQLLCSCAIRECYRVLRGQSAGAARAVALLRVVEAARRALPASAPAATQHCMQLYSTLQASADPEVSKFCTQALLDIRLHLHCSPPSLNFALVEPTDKQSALNKRKMISDKNMSVLKSLLGSERMSALTEPDNVITIPDEPSSKKLRPNEETEKISVSSDSVNSIASSDDSEVEEIEINEEVDGAKKVTADNMGAIIEENTSGSPPMENNKNIPVDSEAATKKSIECVEDVCDYIINMENSKNIESELEKILETDFEQEKIKENNTEINSKVIQEDASIHSATTQMPLNTITDTVDEREESSQMEVVYDYPGKELKQVTFVNEADDDVITSTCDTDDTVITCGQIIKCSQDSYQEKKSDDTDDPIIEIPKVNGNVSRKDIPENGVNIAADNASIHDVDIKDGVSEANKTKQSDVSIEDMMADFVDEVNEDLQ